MLITIVVSVGCSRTPPRIVGPSIPDAAGQAAIAEYDEDGDGAIGGAELDKSPPIKSALSRLDLDNDGKVSAEEIDARIRSWRETRIGLVQCIPVVMLDGVPLSGAQVRLVPEKFLGTDIQPAETTTFDTGEAPLAIAGDQSLTGVQLGLYRIEVSKKSGDKETIPSRYNSETELGVEISPENAIVERDWKIVLRSK